MLVSENIWTKREHFTWWLALASPPDHQTLMKACGKTKPNIIKHLILYSNSDKMTTNTMNIKHNPVF